MHCSTVWESGSRVGFSWGVSDIGWFTGASIVEFIQKGVVSSFDSACERKGGVKLQSGLSKSEWK